MSINARVDVAHADFNNAVMPSYQARTEGKFQSRIIKAHEKKNHTNNGVVLPDLLLNKIHSKLEYVR